MGAFEFLLIILAFGLILLPDRLLILTIMCIFSPFIIADTYGKGKIIGFLQWAGVIAGVVIIAIFGIKYMMGSLEEKAEYKKTMMPYIVGAALIFAASALATVVYNFMKGISTT